MDMKSLKQINQKQQVTQDTVNALTEPIQPMYLMLKPEQYNLLAQHISFTGSAIVQNTDLISELPTQEGVGQSDKENDSTELNSDATDRRGRYELD